MSIGNLSSPSCSSVNVMNLFTTHSRRRRSHGHRKHKSSDPHDISFNSLLEDFPQPLGIHIIRTKLFALTLSKIKILSEDCLSSATSDPFSLPYKLNAIILDISKRRLYTAVRSDLPVQDNVSFLKLRFANKGIDAINISNILHHKDVQKKIPNYFKNHTQPKVSYSYTGSIATKVFNYRQTLTDISAYDIIKSPPTCDCSTSPFRYGPHNHVITGDLNIVNNSKLKNILSKGPKYREPQSFTWKKNFKLIMDSVEDYARRWAKREDFKLDTLSEWVKSIRTRLKRRLYMLSKSMNTKYESVFNDSSVLTELSGLHDKYVIVPADKASNNIVFVCKAYYYDCLIKELGIGDTTINPTYQHSTFAKEDIISNHMSVISSFGITINEEDYDLPSLYWIPKLHKNPYKQRYIAGSTKCSTKPLS
jgi:hypothetical protein